MAKESVGDIFYNAFIDKLQEQLKELDSKDGKLIKSKANNTRVAMTDEEERAERVYRANIQAQKFVRSCRDPAFKTSDGKKTDVFVFRHNQIEIIDCKFSDNSEFYIDKNDIEKGLDLAQRIEQRNLPAQFGIDMHFPKRRRRRIIYLDERNRGHSVKIWIAGKRIMTAII